MSFHRRIDIRMWGDEKFRKLSKPQPNAQTLWTYLLTGKHTGPVPGLSAVGRAALAEELEWTLRAFDDKWKEIAAQGMACADWESKVVWLPNALAHNFPHNEKTVKSWLEFLDGIPECELKHRALGFIWAALTRRDEARAAAAASGGKPVKDRLARPLEKRFGQAWLERLGKPFRIPYPVPLPKQEKEEEEDEEEEVDPPSPPAAAGGGESEPPAPPARVRRGRRTRSPVVPTALTPAAARVVEAIREAVGAPYGPEACGALEDRLRGEAPALTEDQALAIVRWATRDRYWARDVELKPSVIFAPERAAELLARAIADERRRGPVENPEEAAERDFREELRHRGRAAFARLSPGDQRAITAEAKAGLQARGQAPFDWAVEAEVDRLLNERLGPIRPGEYWRAITEQLAGERREAFA